MQVIISRQPIQDFNGQCRYNRMADINDKNNILFKDGETQV